MGKPRRRPKRTPEQFTQKVRECYAAGINADMIAKLMGNTTGVTVRKRLRDLGIYGRWKRCKLSECYKMFFSIHEHKVYCCIKHAKRGCMRRGLGVRVGYRKCLLPECREVLIAYDGKKYCCKGHGSTHLSRIKEGVYERLLGTSKDRCLVCGEKLILDVHHVLLSAGEDGQIRSVKNGPTVLLCPTHHSAIHRGMAKITEEGKFAWVTQRIVENLLD